MTGSPYPPTARGSTSQAEPSAMRGADSGDYLDALNRDDCIRLLGLHAVGRIGATVRALPAVFPVNYVVRDDEILFRTRSGGELDAATRDTVVALEVDDLDTFAHEGWSVLVVGYCRVVSDPTELDDLRRAPPHPLGRWRPGLLQGHLDGRRHRTADPPRPPRDHPLEHPRSPRT